MSIYLIVLVLRSPESSLSPPGTHRPLVRVSWTALDPKNLKKTMVFEVFTKAGLWIWSACWLSWDYIGPFLGQSAPKRNPEMSMKVVQKVYRQFSKRCHQTNTNKHISFIPKIDSKMLQDGDHRALHFQARAS